MPTKPNWHRKPNEMLNGWSMKNKPNQWLAWISHENEHLPTKLNRHRKPNQPHVKDLILLGLMHLQGDVSKIERRLTANGWGRYLPGPTPAFTLSEADKQKRPSTWTPAFTLSEAKCLKHLKCKKIAHGSVRGARLMKPNGCSYRPLRGYEARASASSHVFRTRDVEFAHSWWFVRKRGPFGFFSWYSLTFGVPRNADQCKHMFKSGAKKVRCKRWADSVCTWLCLHLT